MYVTQNIQPRSPVEVLNIKSPLEQNCLKPRLVNVFACFGLWNIPVVQNNGTCNNDSCTTKHAMIVNFVV